MGVGVITLIVQCICNLMTRSKRHLLKFVNVLVFFWLVWVAFQASFSGVGVDRSFCSWVASLSNGQQSSLLLRFASHHPLINACVCPRAWCCTSWVFACCNECC